MIHKHYIILDTDDTRIKINYIKPDSNRSRAMTTIFKMDAVQQNTSAVIQKSQMVPPMVQAPVNWYLRDTGNTTNATSRSALAKDTINQLVKVLMSRNKVTESTTHVLPTTVKAINAARVHPINAETRVEARGESVNPSSAPFSPSPATTDAQLALPAVQRGVVKDRGACPAVIAPISS